MSILNEIMTTHGMLSQTGLGQYREALKNLFAHCKEQNVYRVRYRSIAAAFTQLDIFKGLEGGKAYNRSYKYLRQINLAQLAGWESRECANCSTRFAVALHSDLKQCIMCDACAPQADGCNACAHRVACCHGQPPFTRPNKDHFNCRTCEQRLECVAEPC